MKKMIKIAKEFDWEMGHRLTFHEGPCRNVHGHTYTARIEVEGNADEYGIVIDYYIIEKTVRPLLEKLDHSFLCNGDDKNMIEFLKAEGMKYNLMSGHSTAENIAIMLLNEMVPEFKKHENVKILRVRVNETPDTFAEVSQAF